MAGTSTPPSKKLKNGETSLLSSGKHTGLVISATAKEKARAESLIEDTVDSNKVFVSSVVEDIHDFNKVIEVSANDVSAASAAKDPEVFSPPKFKSVVQKKLFSRPTIVVRYDPEAYLAIVECKTNKPMKLTQYVGRLAKDETNDEKFDIGIVHVGKKKDPYLDEAEWEYSNDGKHRNYQYLFLAPFDIKGELSLDEFLKNLGVKFQKLLAKEGVVGLYTVTADIEEQFDLHAKVANLVVYEDLVDYVNWMYKDEKMGVALFFRAPPEFRTAFFPAVSDWTEFAKSSIWKRKKDSA